MAPNSGGGIEGIRNELGTSCLARDRPEWKKLVAALCAALGTLKGTTTPIDQSANFRLYLFDLGHPHGLLEKLWKK